MKKIIFTILLLMVAFVCFADSGIELSWYPDYDIYDYTENKEIFYDMLFSTTLYFDKEVSIITIGGDIETIMLKSDLSWTFYPVSVDYGVFLEAEIIDDVTIGMEHRCEHPVNPYDGIIETKNPNKASNRVYVDIKF